MRSILSLTRKEFERYFGSPMALIFVGVFLVTSLFSFFWIDGFFARNIADIRPLFKWMPLLLIFLIAALTMRQWSEEQQNGTLEILLTLPMRVTSIVIAKFLSVIGLVALALFLTISLPITVSLIGNPDPGPIIGGYFAALLLAAAYSAIGLFVSSSTDNQIVSLIMTIVIGGVFYLIGSSTITGLFSYDVAELLRAFGTGSHFESIERGVIDIRDILYYVSVTIIFLILNIMSLEMRRWSRSEKALNYRFNQRIRAGFLIANLILFNILLFPVSSIRADLTANDEYTLAPITHDLLDNLQEPLLIRGYFSEETHPALAPLIPRVQDMLKEYRIASNGSLEVEFIDPLNNPELEAEANQTYGIRPTPLRVSGRSGTSVVNAYFDILIRYGDQTIVLNLLEDLIEVNEVAGALDVRLRNLEYDLTSAIQRVVYGFQSIDSVLASLEQPAQLTLYVTSDTLPEEFAMMPDIVETVSQDIATRSDGQFAFEMVNVNDPDDDITVDSLFEQYQIRPIATGFLSSDTFLLHMVLQANNETQIIYPPGEMSEVQIRNSIESALKRTASGFLQVVGVWTPSSTPQMNAFGQPAQSLQQYNTIQETLRENYEVQRVDLSTGRVPDDIDTLLVLAPQNMTDLERYAIDQYLMRGGSVFVATGNYLIASDTGGSLTLSPVENGLQDWLSHYGISVQEQLVMDTQNAPFPVQTSRNVGGLVVNEIQAIDYPYFIDVRPDNMNQTSPITQNIPSVIANWASPIETNLDEESTLSVTPLLESSAQAWITSTTSIQPDFTQYPDVGFAIPEEQMAHTLAVAIEGQFDSYFIDRPSPFQATEATSGTTDTGTPVEPVNFIQNSPDSARLVVVGSAEFLNDNVLNLAQNIGGDQVLNNLQFVQNTVDWFVGDTALASIRSSSSSARLLQPLSENQRSFIEIGNYVFALVSLVILGVIWQTYRRNEAPMELTPEPPGLNPRNRLDSAHSSGGTA